MAHYRNCSPTGNGWIYGGKDGKAAQHEAAYRDEGEERCVGPFAFAKGPMAMAPLVVARALVPDAIDSLPEAIESVPVAMALLAEAVARVP